MKEKAIVYGLILLIIILLTDVVIWRQVIAAGIIEFIFYSITFERK